MIGTSIDGWLVDIVVNVTYGAVGLTSELLEQLRAKLLVDEIGGVGRVLVLQSVVAPAERQLAVADEPHFARTVGTAPIVAVLVAPVVVEVVVFVDDRQPVAFRAAERHVDRRVRQHRPAFIVIHNSQSTSIEMFNLSQQTIQIRYQWHQ